MTFCNTIDKAVNWTGVMTGMQSGMLETVFSDFLKQESAFQDLFFYIQNLLFYGGIFPPPPGGIFPPPQWEIFHHPCIS
jgi:hypothetical protein